MKFLKTVKGKFIAAKNWFLKASLIKKGLVVMGLALVIFLGTSPLRSNSKPLYTTEAVTRETISEIVSESGNVTTGQVSVFSPSTGIIEETYVSNGDQVKSGQNLFKVKSTASPQDKATAYTNYQNAVSTEKTAEQSKQTLDATMWTKQQTLLSAQNSVNYKNDNTTNPSTKNDYTDLEKQAIDSSLVQAQKDFSAAEQKYKEADVAISAAKASVSSTWLAYQATQDMIVTAPIPGTVGNLLSHIGDNVAANVSSGITTTSTSPVLVIGNPDGLYITTEINEVDHPKITVGQKATITFSAIKNKTFEGKVSGIDTFGTNTAGVITYNLSLSVTNVDQAVAPGMTASIDIEANKRESVLTVPNSAIKAYQGAKAVQILDTSGKPKFIPVKIGLKSPTRTEVIEGISEGTKVVTNSPKTTSSGGLLGGGN